MEDFNNVGMGKHPTDDQNKPKSPATGPASNKRTAPAKARTSRTGSSASKASSIKAPATSSARKKSSGGDSDVPRGVKSTDPSADQSPTVSKITAAEPDTKIMVSDVSEEEVPIERELQKHSQGVGQHVQPKEVRADYIKSIITQIKPSDEDAELPSKEEMIPPKSVKGKASGKKIKKLEKKSLKAEKKVDKLMDKYKQARKDNVKRGKLQNVKDKLLKAFSKLRKRHRKLRNAVE